MNHDHAFDRPPVSAGPGWFESSFDLHRGLDVREAWSDGSSVDARVAHRLEATDAPLVSWGGRDAAPARSRPSGGG